jgi:ABC-type transport system involved in multi-copper enzyme maturation permease subunit
MWGAFTSELTKLQRRGMLLGGFGAGMLFPLLATIFTIERSRVYPPFNRGHVSVLVLEAPNGLVHGVTDVSVLLGVVSLVVFAAAFAQEYSQGTLRNLLVREPRRAQLLTGKFLAISLFMLAVVLVAIGLSIALAFILAPGKDISTAAWTSSTGLNDLFQAILHAYLATLFYGVFGAMFAILLRSPAASIGVSLAYFIAIEAIIVGAIWSGGNNWLPDHLLGALVHGGNSDSTYYHALLMLTIYSIVVAAGTITLFRRRDA